MKRLKSYLSSIIIIHCFIAATLIRTISSSNTWPGDSSVTTVDKADEFGSNLSGLHYYVSESNDKISSDFLYGILNDPSTIYKLYWDGLYWKKYEGSDSANLLHLSLDGSLSHYSSITPLSEDC